jgi:anthranilate phosphoribosyltransferase
MPNAISLAVQTLQTEQSVPRDLMESVMDGMLSGACSSDEMHSFLLAIQCKGETVEELVGAASAMRRAMVRIDTDFPVVLDTCGTGGDGSKTFNISTAAAVVIAAAGIPVAKHGNRKITSSTGSADVLAELGINLEATPKVVQRCLNELKICFCFAPRFHPAMKHVADVRRRITGPTLFNRLGPLCNPASANRQVLGVGSADLQDKLAAALFELGTQRSIVVRGLDGVDEVSLESPTSVIALNAVGRQMMTWQPADFGLKSQGREHLFADSPASSAACIREALSGREGACRDAVILNAAAGLWVADHSRDLMECQAAAADAIDSGRATELIAKLGKLTQA